MTGWSDILTSALTLIDDVRWREDLQTSPALFYRAKSDYVRMAMPMLNRPPQLQYALENGMQTPSFGEASWISPPGGTFTPTDVSTGMIGYSLCSVTIRGADGMLTPYTGATYNAETGVVTFPEQTGGNVEYSIDFYTDGEFPDLTPTEMRLFALAVAIVWDEHFDRNWLNLQPKIKDASFETVNEATFSKQANERMRKNRAILSDELNKYEQDCAYRNRLKPPYSTTLI